MPDADPAPVRRDRIIAEIRGWTADRERDAQSGRSAQARLQAAEERDELACAGDLAALERDRAAEERTSR